MNYIGYVQVNSLGIQTLNKKEILYSGVYCDIPSTEKKGGGGVFERIPINFQLLP